MEEKKLINSKLWLFFDWVWRLMVLNVLVIITSIGIVTIMPSLCAAFKTIKDTKENYSPHIFKNYFKNFSCVINTNLFF